MVDGEGDGFLSRWSRRKAQARTGDPVPAIEHGPDAVAGAQAELGKAPDALQAPRGTDVPTPATPAVADADAADAASGPDALAPPTLDDVERLTPDADFSPFVDRMVQPEVRNAAMKKLFSDPHFSVMDGLDVYIDDYNKTEPMPRQWLRQLVQARVLGLLDDEVEEQPLPDADVAPSIGAVDVAAEVADDLDKPAQAAHAQPSPDTPRPHEDADLPLQPHDAARHPGARAAADDDPGSEHG